MQIRDLSPHEEGIIQQIAEILVEAFRENWPEAFPNLEEALETVNESFEEEKISRVAVDADGLVLGWIGGQPFYSEVWELHPLVVRPSLHRSGVGRALVSDLEKLVKERGGLTLTLGTDDDNDMTTLSGVDLYIDTWRHIQNIKNLKGHPYEFYQKLGYTITGIMPDANGIGKPDILMSKRL